MPTPFIMPKFDMDQESSLVIEWLKQEGDYVKLDEIVLVVETDKVAVDVPAPAAGTLARISAKAGDEVPITSVIAYILDVGETIDDLPLLSAIPEISPPDGARKKSERPAASRQEKRRDFEVGVTPIAQRMIVEQGINIHQITAAGGRITKKDVQRFLAQFPQPSGRVETPATPAARRLVRELGLDLKGISGSGPGGRIQALDVEQAAEHLGPASVPDRPADIVPLTGSRRTMAERMQTSFQTAPHIFLTVEVDVSNLEEKRKQLNSAIEKDTDANISLTAMLVSHIAQALVNHPYLNSSLIGEHIYLWQEVNIGLATAIDEGLIVPVIHNANQLGVIEINTRIKELSRKARDGKLQLVDVHGGTFTLSNLGMFGIDQFQAIINPPESAILAVGQVIRKPVVVGGQDRVAVRPRMSLTLSADHRVIDGVTAARFLNDLLQAIESPNQQLDQKISSL
jgi:pyruvate dehydrogenase E2 component (dihydrolipoamide acetyltransferase)